MSHSTIIRVALAIACSAASQAGLAARYAMPDAVTDADYAVNPPAKVLLGKFLYWDKILSGNENISCASCHHALAATGDGLSLPVGEGGSGLGITRNTGADESAVNERVPRNAPPVFNLGALEFSKMFHDGRVAADDSQASGFRSPAGSQLPSGLDSALAVQAMFPPTSGTEMAGQAGENPLADAAAANNLAGEHGVWQQLAGRLQGNAEYVDLFMAAYPEVTAASDITMVHAANAIAAYEAAAFRADNSPFDRFLRGEKTAMSRAARNGKKLFYGKAGCAACHSGKFQTDQEFHAVAMPQIGPGKGDGGSGYLDFGREQVTGEPIDRYKFRTPSLRNVALTGPWGHDGAYNSLRAAVEHMLDPVSALDSYDSSQAVLPYREDLADIDFLAHDDPAARAELAAANELSPVDLSALQVDELMAFLHALTDETSLDLRSSVPYRVPSGLPLAD